MEHGTTKHESDKTPEELSISNIDYAGTSRRLEEAALYAYQAEILRLKHAIHQLWALVLTTAISFGAVLAAVLLAGVSAWLFFVPLLVMGIVNRRDNTKENNDE